MVVVAGEVTRNTFSVVVVVASSLIPYVLRFVAAACISAAYVVLLSIGFIVNGLARSVAIVDVFSVNTSAISNWNVFFIMTALLEFSLFINCHFSFIPRGFSMPLNFVDNGRAVDVIIVVVVVVGGMVVAAAVGDTKVAFFIIIINTYINKQT